MSEIHRLGTTHDEAFRLHNRRVDNEERRSAVQKAWNLIYLRGKGIGSKQVEDLLEDQSLLPVRVCYLFIMFNTATDIQVLECIFNSFIWPWI